jgi:hypothetical protein
MQNIRVSGDVPSENVFNEIEARVRMDLQTELYPKFILSDLCKNYFEQKNSQSQSQTQTQTQTQSQYQSQSQSQTKSHTKSHSPAKIRLLASHHISHLNTPPIRPKQDKTRTIFSLSPNLKHHQKHERPQSISPRLSPRLTPRGTSKSTSLQTSSLSTNSFPSTMKLNLKDVLDDPPSFNVFMEFAKSSFAAENLLCWRAIANFRSTSESDRKRLFDEVFDAYLSTESEMELNISSQQRLELNALRERETPPSADVLDEVEAVLWMDMATELFPRFKQSSELQNFLSSRPESPSTCASRKKLEAFFGEVLPGDAVAINQKMDKKSKRWSTMV